MRKALALVVLLWGPFHARAEGGERLTGISGKKVLELRQELESAGQRLEDVVAGRMKQIGLAPKAPDGTYVASYAAGSPSGTRQAGRNLLGAIAGHDPSLRGEVVLVGAATERLSSIAVVLHVAEALVKRGWNPKRTIHFASLGGAKGSDGEDALAGDHLPTTANLVAALMIGEVELESELNRLDHGNGAIYPDASGVALFPALGEPLMTAVGSTRLLAEEPLSMQTMPLVVRGVPRIELAATFHSTGGLGMEPGPLGESTGDLAHWLAGMTAWLGDAGHPLAQSDAHERMLLCEASRSHWAPTIDAGSSERGFGLCVALRDAVIEPPRPAAEDLRAAIKELTETLPPDILLMYSGSGFEQARNWRAGFIWCRLRWRDRLPAPAEIQVARAEGFDWVAPFAGGRATAAERDALFSACTDARVLTDLTGLPEEEYADARRRLVFNPAVLPVKAEEWMGARGEARRRLLGPAVLLLADGDPKAALALALDAREGLAPAVVVSGDSKGLLAALVEHKGERKPDWANPESADRTALRLALGARLAVWVKRVE